MKDYTRRGVVYVVSEILGMSKDSVYDWNEKNFYSFGNNDNIYDYSETSFISVEKKSNNNYMLFHYKHRKFIELKIKSNGKEFEGFDYDSYKHFSGQINGSDIKIYDFEFGKWYSYSV